MSWHSEKRQPRNERNVLWTNVDLVVNVQFDAKDPPPFLAAQNGEAEEWYAYQEVWANTIIALITNYYYVGLVAFGVSASYYSIFDHFYLR